MQGEKNTLYCVVNTAYCLVQPMLLKADQCHITVGHCMHVSTLYLPDTHSKSWEGVKEGEEGWG